MGWTAHYQFLRDTPLSRDEITAIAALNLESATSTWDGEPFGVNVAPSPRADRVLAEGWSKLPMGESDDPELLDDMLMRFLEIATDAEIRIVDDFNAFGWDAEKRCISGGRRTPDLVTVERGELVDPKTIAAPPLPPLPDPAAALVTAVAAGRDVTVANLDDAAVAALLCALPRIESDDPRRPTIRALLEQASPERVVTIGFRDYASLATTYHARSAIEHALRKVDDPAAFVDAFLEVWCEPGGTYYYGDLPLPERFLDAIAPAPAVVAQMAEDVATAEAADEMDEMPFRRAEHAVRLLARGRTDQGLHALVAMIRRCRDRKQSWRLELNVFDVAHEHLALHGDTRVFATLLHFLGTMTKDHRGHRAALEALARIDPARARPHVFAIADLGAMMSTIVSALAALGDDAALARLRELTRHPDRSVHVGARHALTAAGIDPGPEPTLPPPEELITHPERDVRHGALRTLHDRKDRALMLSLCAAETLDAILRARTDDGGLPFSWHGWDDLLPPEVPRMRAATRLRWALGDGAASLGPQQRLAAVEPILASGATAVAATMPSSLYRLTADELMALQAEEATMLAALGTAEAK